MWRVRCCAELCQSAPKEGFQSVEEQSSDFQKRSRILVVVIAALQIS